MGIVLTLEYLTAVFVLFFFFFYGLDFFPMVGVILILVINEGDKECASICGHTFFF
jgi:hypothetical protein